MEISINTKKLAVIGDPISHSLSPFLQNNIIETNGFDAVYLPMRVWSGETGRFCDAARMMGFSGFNATMPHKQSLVEIVDELDPEATSYGAVNTVKITEQGRLIGYNTDVRGLLTALKRQNVSLEGTDIMVIGAGGVAGAFVKGCGGENVKRIAVLNRTYAKAVDLCRGISYAEAFVLDSSRLAEEASRADVIVNCTSLGMSGTGSDFEDLSFLDNTQALLCDLIYNPWETKFLSYGRSCGLKTINGMDMLIYQGLIAFEIFMDVKLDYNKEYERLLPLCRAQLMR